MEVDSARSGPPPQGPRSFSPILGGAQGHGWDPEQLELVGEGALSPRQGMGEHKVPSNATTRRFHSSTMAKVPSDPNHTAIPRRALPPPSPASASRSAPLKTCSCCSLTQPRVRSSPETKPTAAAISGSMSARGGGPRRWLMAGKGGLTVGACLPAACPLGSARCCPAQLAVPPPAPLRR